MKNVRRVGVLVVVMVTAVGLVWGVMLAPGMLAPQAALAQSAPSLSGDTQPTYELMAPTRIANQKLYTAAPARRSGGLDMSLTKGYAGADIFVTAELAPGAELDVTVELSADQVHWTPVRYETTDYLENDVLSVVPMAPLNRVLDEDGETAYMLVVLAGQYLRVGLEATGVTTPTVWVTYRDYPQWP